MSPRPRSGILVSAMIRRVAQAGGSAAVLARGDEDAGGILVICAERGEIVKIIERRYDLAGRAEWQETAPQVIDKTLDLADYLARRRRVDEDLWAVELDIADSERFAAGFAGDG